jgi:hypothetical protein
MGEPIKVFDKNGREVTVYGPNQLAETLAGGAVTDNPIPNAQPLPDDFPAAAILRAGGYTTLDALGAADDDALMGVYGVGDATLQEVRAALKANAPKPAAPKESVEEKVMKGKFAK